MATNNWEPGRILKRHVLLAAKTWHSSGYQNFRNSLSYDVIIGGKPYPPKAICSCAHELATGRSLSPSEFVGARDGLWHRRLKELGFTIVGKRPEMDFYMEVASALKLKPKRRALLLAQLPNRPPERVATLVYRYDRSPLVVAERLSLANGICEDCGNAAPFKRRKDGSPYLEVHHVKPLSRGGLDLVENTKAVCPNCHCRIHDAMSLDILNE